jgi:tetratricopeptide (TPR) repeat protein
LTGNGTSQPQSFVRPHPSTPYPGARPFRQADRDRFFGRTKDIAALAALWKLNRLTLVAGPAGRGKTSLLQAGVLPALADDDLDILPVGRLSHGGTFPFAALPVHNPYTLALLRSWSPGETATRLVGLTVPEFFQRRAENRLGRSAGSRSMLAAIDAADELLADEGPRRTYQARFLGELAKAVREIPRLHLLVIAREEAIAVVSDALGGGARRDIAALSWQGAFDAAYQPMTGVGRSIAKEAIENLLNDLFTIRVTGDGGTHRGGADRYVSGSEVEPALLQVICAHLWDSLPPETEVITDRDIRRNTDVDEALAAHLRGIIAEVAVDHNRKPERLGTWIQYTFITKPGGRNHVYEGATETAGMPNAVVRALEDRHLLISWRRSGSRWYELLSDRLIEPLREVTDAGLLSVEPGPSVEPGSYLRTAEHALALGEWDLAEQYALEVLRTPLGTAIRAHAEASSLLGNVAFERGRMKEAEKHYRKAADLFGALPDNAAVAYQLAAVGQTLLAQGLAAAEQTLVGEGSNSPRGDASPRTPLDSPRGDASPRIPLVDDDQALVGDGSGGGETLEAQQKLTEAVEELQAAAARLPNDSVIQTGLALALWQFGDARAAVAVLTRALGIDGANIAALRARGEILADLGEANDAMLDLDRLSMEGRPSARAARALALAELGDHAAARQEIERALAEAARNGRVLLFAARASQVEGNDGLAKDYARQAAYAADPPLSPRQREIALRLADGESTSRR